jgi:hypothetical protein
LRPGYQLANLRQPIDPRILANINIENLYTLSFGSSTTCWLRFWVIIGALGGREAAACSGDVEEALEANRVPKVDVSVRVGYMY